VLRIWSQQKIFVLVVFSEVRLADSSKAQNKGVHFWNPDIRLIIIIQRIRIQKIDRKYFKVKNTKNSLPLHIFGFGITLTLFVLRIWNQQKIFWLMVF
jgi:hypothetical protein